MPHSLFLADILKHEYLAYLFFLLGVIIEGEIALFLAFFAVGRGYLHLGEVLLIAFNGVIIGDFLWYSLGSFFQGKIKYLRNYVGKAAKPIDNQLKKNATRAIFISKFIYGTHRITLLRAGSLKISFKEYIRADVPASILWIVLLGSLAYISSLSYDLFKKYLRYTEMSFIFGIIIFLVIAHVLKQISKKIEK